MAEKAIKFYDPPTWILDILEENEISIAKCPFYDTTNGGVYEAELSWMSPEGEDVLISFDFDGTDEGFVKAFRSFADDFDPDEHADMHIPNRGERGVPKSIRTLIDDADAIKTHLCRTADVLQFRPRPINVGKISIDLGQGKKLCVERNVDPDYREIFVFIEDENGVAVQDLAIVGQNYVYDDEGNVVPTDGKFFVKVYEDETNENYTTAFDIPEYRGTCCDSSQNGTCELSPDDNPCDGSEEEMRQCAYK